jgi:hypothetical protein
MWDMRRAKMERAFFCSSLKDEVGAGASAVSVFDGYRFFVWGSVNLSCCWAYCNVLKRVGVREMFQNQLSEALLFEDDDETSRVASPISDTLPTIHTSASQD